MKKASSNSYRKLRESILKNYGNACECCKENIYEFLCLDHINGDGGKHRKAGIKGKNMLLWVRDNNYPDTIRILCYNCNNAVRYGRVCPHQQ